MYSRAGISVSFQMRKMPVLNQDIIVNWRDYIYKIEGEDLVRGMTKEKYDLLDELGLTDLTFWKCYFE